MGLPQTSFDSFPIFPQKYFVTCTITTRAAGPALTGAVISFVHQRGRPERQQPPSPASHSTLQDCLLAEGRASPLQRVKANKPIGAIQTDLWWEQTNTVACRGPNANICLQLYLQKRSSLLSNSGEHKDGNVPNPAARALSPEIQR